MKRELGALAEARKGYEESLLIRQEIGDKRGGAMGRVELAMVLLEQGELASSKRTIGEALSLARDVKLRPGEAQALYVLGEIALAEGALADARKHHEAALAIRKEMREDRTVVESRLALAGIALEEGRAAEAETETTELRNSLSTGNALPAQAAAELLLGRALLAQNKVDAAAQTVIRTQKMSAATQRLYLRVMHTITAARVDSARQNWYAGDQRLRNLLATLKASGAAKLQFETRLAECETQFHSGPASAARECSVRLETDSENRGFKRIARMAKTLASRQ